MTDSSETNMATYESIEKDINTIHEIYRKYLDGETSGIYLGGAPEDQETELSDLIQRNKDLMREIRTYQDLFGMVDSAAYLATQFALALYNEWEEYFDGEWRLQAMRAVCSGKTSTSTKRPWE